MGTVVGSVVGSVVGDWVVGGTVVVTGTPEEVAKCEASYTGQYLIPVLKRKK